MRIFVDELPKTHNDCPFYNQNNKKCSISNKKCDMSEDKVCDNLATLQFDIIGEE